MKYHLFVIFGRFNKIIIGNFSEIKRQMEKDVEEVTKIAHKAKASLEQLDREVYVDIIFIFEYQMLCHIC
jgi:hypothetical protein